ncbi:MAG: D-alanine--D-alanine ligase [Alphaproteobacteria bacterium]|nr:D-alanine--D-alanine ligase [Alphaproteobacteria bacterium]
MSPKKKVAVFLGGAAPEHDVSVITGLQVLDALDRDLFDAFPVYIALNGTWLTGEALRKRESYIPAPGSKGLEVVTLRPRQGQKQAHLVTGNQGIFKKEREITLDFAIPAFHGAYGEDGGIQGMLEVCGVPYSGMRVMASALLMNKVATKHMLAGKGIPLLPFHVIERPSKGLLILAQELQSLYPDIAFPCCAKPVSLGSSIGVAKVKNWDELASILPMIFQYDSAAILEPFVPNLVEYNVAVCRLGGKLRSSAIERPKHSDELLDFKTKYLSGDGKTDGPKTTNAVSEGMLSLTRDINPSLDEVMENNIRTWAETAFDVLGGTGAPRFDFLCDRQTGGIWFNEGNACPGSFGFFLWEAAKDPISFSVLLEMMIEEGETCFNSRRLPDDPVPEDARLLPRK